MSKYNRTANRQLKILDKIDKIEQEKLKNSENEPLDTSPYNMNRTRLKFLNIVQGLKLKGYQLIRDKENFFIWKKGEKSEYIRLSLHTTRGKEPLFYWDLELSFKPFSYKHNHRDGAHIQSEYFKASDTDKFYNYFLNMIDKVKGGLRT